MCVCVLWCFGVGGNRRNALTGGMFVISCPPCSFLLLHTHTHVQTHLDAHAHTLRGVGTMMGEISSVCVWVWGHKNALIKIERGQNDGCLSLVPCENTHTHTCRAALWHGGQQSLHETNKPLVSGLQLPWQQSTEYSVCELHEHLCLNVLGVSTSHTDKATWM